MTTATDITTTVTMEQTEPGSPPYRTVRRIPGDITGGLVVPTVEQATANLQQSWEQFGAALDAIRPRVTSEEATALDNAAVMIETDTRSLATAHLLAGAASMNHHEVGSFYLPTM
jgi:hypothetical protein